MLKIQNNPLAKNTMKKKKPDKWMALGIEESKSDLGVSTHEPENQFNMD